MDDSDNDLHHFVCTGDLESIKLLIANGAQINAFDEISFTPLHHAADKGQIELVRFLLDNGAEINLHQEERIGNTVLREVAGNCTFDMAKVLIDSGADPTIPGWMQLTALDKTSERKKPEGKRVHELLHNAAAKLHPGWDKLKDYRLR